MQTIFHLAYEYERGEAWDVFEQFCRYLSVVKVNLSVQTNGIWVEVWGDTLDSTQTIMQIFSQKHTLGVVEWPDTVDLFTWLMSVRERELKLNGPGRTTYEEYTQFHQVK